MPSTHKRWHRHSHKNILYLAIGVGLALWLHSIKLAPTQLETLKQMGVLAAILGGALFESTFTVALGIVILGLLAPVMNGVELGLLAGLGGVLTNGLIFHFVRKGGLATEIESIVGHLGGVKLRHLLHTKYFTWSLPVLGALIIASPLPDELGVTLLGISHMKPYQFLLLSFVLNALGIFAVVSLSSWLML